MEQRNVAHKPLGYIFPLYSVVVSVPDMQNIEGRTAATRVRIACHRHVINVSVVYRVLVQ